MAVEQQTAVFHFGDFEVSERDMRLTRAGETLALEPKAFGVLLYLLHNPGRLVTKDELLNAVKKLWLLKRTPSPARSRITKPIETSTDKAISPKVTGLWLRGSDPVGAAWYFTNVWLTGNTSGDVRKAL